ncbi:MAG: hypothetical protein HZC48_04605 [Nitrospirae bacterium]|nr:hypothetical protein [Nitrospirota bacterium]
MGIKWFFRMLACIPLLVASTAWSVEIHGRSSTQFLWFNDIVTDEKQAEFTEYLNFSITQLDKDNKLSITGYGRVSQAIHGSERLNGRLYFLYLNYRDLYDKIDLRLGRQFVNYAAGTAIVDGGKAELKNIGPVAFSVMGGRNVFFNLNGEGTGSEDFVLGAAAYLVGLKSTDAEISYFVKWDEDGIARDQLGASFKQYLLNSIKVYANARFDLASESFSEALVGGKYYPSSALVFTGEWYQSYPNFDNTSIYAVFAVDRYEEAVFRADYTISDKISVNTEYNRQMYETGDADVFELGCRIRPLEHLQVSLNYDYRNGDGGNLNGGIAEVSYEASKKLELAGGIHYDVYERDRTTGRETARKYWTGGNYKINKDMSASVRIEDNVNATYENDWQGRLAFNYNF